MIIQTTDQLAIESHLGNIQRMPNFTLSSCFMGALRDARKFTKRNQDTGKKLADDSCGDHGSWLGTIGYLALLDQIGGCFKPKGIATITGNCVIKALRYYTSISQRDADAIYALRCSLAHDFGLFNYNPKKPNLTHLFTLHQSPSGPVVKLPTIQWDGDYQNIVPDNSTWINLEALGDMVEEIYLELLRLASKSELEIVLAGGAVELVTRYSIIAPKTH